MRVRVLLRRLFDVATITDRNGTHYCVTWVAGDAVDYRRWRWWSVRDWPPLRPTEEPEQ